MTQPEHTHPTTFSTQAADGAPLNSTENDHLALPVGTRVAEFVITGLIGIGGFGIVYQAHDESLDREVALKEYMPSALAMRQQGNTVSARSQRSADTFQAGLRSFINEARMLALFNHPALVKVYRFWESNGTAYMVMPFYQGQTLKKTLADMQTPPSEAWLRQLLHPLLEALEIIHAKNCFHRDIAPDNILMLNSGQPVLLDFGAARQVISDMANNLTVILKPGYAPIEQYASDPNMPQGAWTDIYALGAVMHLAIAGHEPHTSVSRIVNDSYEPLAQRSDKGYSQSFLATIDQTLALKPDDRPQSVDELRSLLTGTSSTAWRAHLNPQINVQPPALPASGQHRSALPWVLVTLVLLLGAGGYFFTQSSQPAAAVAQPVPEAVVAASATMPQAVQTVQNTPAITTPADTAAPAATAVEETRTPESSILTEMRETVPNKPPTQAASVAGGPSPATALAAAASASKKDSRPAPAWLRDMRQKLASCNGQGLIEKLVCIDQTRKKHCAPSHWGEVEECRVNNGLADD